MLGFWEGDDIYFRPLVGTDGVLVPCRLERPSLVDGREQDDQIVTLALGEVRLREDVVGERGVNLELERLGRCTRNEHADGAHPNTSAHLCFAEWRRLMTLSIDVVAIGGAGAGAANALRRARAGATSARTGARASECPRMGTSWERWCSGDRQQRDFGRDLAELILCRIQSFNMLSVDLRLIIRIGPDFRNDSVAVLGDRRELL